MASMQFSAQTNQLSRIRSFIRKHVEELEFTDFEQNNIVLAVDEACANLIQHAYKNNDDAMINLRIIVEPGFVQVEISDTATPFNPGEAELPNMPQYFAEHRHHGLGILLMTRVMDDIKYMPAGTDSDLNTLILTKRRSQ